MQQSIIAHFDCLIDWTLRIVWSFLVAVNYHSVRVGWINEWLGLLLCRVAASVGSKRRERVGYFWLEWGVVMVGKQSMSDSARHENPLFLTVFRGAFQGILRWPQLDQLWAAVLADREGGWFLYAVGETPPQRVAAAMEVETFVREVDALLRHEHQEDYCGIVYVDNFQQPGFIKIFDPGNLGSACGSRGSPPLPGWIMCKIQPVDLPAALPAPNNRRRWWERLFSSY